MRYENKLTGEEIEALIEAIRERCQDTEAAEDVEAIVQIVYLMGDGKERSEDTIHFYLMARRQMDILDALVEGIEYGRLRAVLPEGACPEHLDNYRIENA